MLSVTVCVRELPSGYLSPAATQADWGDAQHARCVQPYSWDELLHGYKGKNISTSFKMGGLGKLVEQDGTAAIAQCSVRTAIASCTDYSPITTHTLTHSLSHLHTHIHTHT